MGAPPQRAPDLAFGHGIHACRGAPLARLEARAELADFLERVSGFERADDGPREALHVHGPSRLPIRFTFCPENCHPRAAPP